MKRYYIQHRNRPTEVERFWSPQYGWTALQFAMPYATTPSERIPFDDEVMPELEKFDLPYNGAWVVLDFCTHEQYKNWNEDYCPVCHEPVLLACKCLRNERSCANGHTWMRYASGLAEILDDGGMHG